MHHIVYYWNLKFRLKIEMFIGRYGFLVFLFISMCLAFWAVSHAGKKMNIPIWKTLVLTMVMGISGYMGAKLWYFIETGNGFAGASLFGGVLLMPVFMIPMKYMVSMPYSTIMDFSAPVGPFMLAVMKIHCFKEGCCYGKVLYMDSSGEAVRFPSQLTEAGANFLLFAVVLYFLEHGKYKDRLYPCALLLYGCIRFLLNLLRETEPFLWILPAGNVWSLLAILIGAVWLFVTRPKKKIQAEE